MPRGERGLHLVPHSPTIQDDSSHPSAMFLLRTVDCIRFFPVHKSTSEHELWAVTPLPCHEWRPGDVTWCHLLCTLPWRGSICEYLPTMVRFLDYFTTGMFISKAAVQAFPLPQPLPSSCWGRLDGQKLFLFCFLCTKDAFTDWLFRTVTELLKISVQTCLPLFNGNAYLCLPGPTAEGTQGIKCSHRQSKGKLISKNTSQGKMNGYVLSGHLCSNLAKYE